MMKMMWWWNTPLHVMAWTHTCGGAFGYSWWTLKMMTPSTKWWCMMTLRVVVTQVIHWGMINLRMEQIADCRCLINCQSWLRIMQKHKPESLQQCEHSICSKMDSLKIKSQDSQLAWILAANQKNVNLKSQVQIALMNLHDGVLSS